VEETKAVEEEEKPQTAEAGEPVEGS